MDHFAKKPPMIHNCPFQSVATAVAEVHMALPSNRTQWTKQYMGVVCLVKDGEARSYFIRLINMEVKSTSYQGSFLFREEPGYEIVDKATE